MNESKVWVVSSGSYSDYSVLFICPRKENAEAYVVGRGELDSELFVEEFDLVESLPSSRTYYYRSVRVDADGSVHPIRDLQGQVFENIDTENDEVKASQWESKGYSDGRRRQLPWRSVLVEGFDKVGVDKAYSERVARAKAELSTIGGP